MNTPYAPLTLSEILAGRHLNAVFQPIAHLDRSDLFGYEALIRGPLGGELHEPQALFAQATAQHRMVDLETLCCETAIRQFHAQQGGGKLFLNVSPVSLDGADRDRGIVQQLLRQQEFPPSRIVIEITEQHPLNDYAAIRDAIRQLKEHGFEIAIDDLGAGYSGLRTWSELRPNYVKIDRHFIANIHADPVKREFVRSIRRIADELNCRVIAEGIETADELARVQSLGIDFGQGFFLGRPKPAPESPQQVRNRLGEARSSQRARVRLTQTVADMALMVSAIDGAKPLEEVFELFHADSKLTSLAVVDDGRVAGIIKRHNLLELMAGRFARELHGRKCVARFMDPDPVCVEFDRSLQAASQRLTTNRDADLSQDFIILKQGRYFGLGKTGTLLKLITEQQMHYARYANPLTLLPGNLPIQERLNEALAGRRDFHVAYIDLNSFKPYNDHYGYEAGDKVLITLARILKDVVDPKQDFLGHVGGDDFIVIFESGQWRQSCERVLELLEHATHEFYDADALARGGIAGRNRRGEPEFFELISAAIGVVHPDPVHCGSGHDVAALASDAKRQAKKQSGSTLFVSRRRRPDCPRGLDGLLHPRSGLT